MAVDLSISEERLGHNFALIGRKSYSVDIDCGSKPHNVHWSTYFKSFRIDGAV